MSTTSGAHGGGESRDGGEELSTPAVKRKCLQYDSMSLVSGLEGEPVTSTIHHQHRHYLQQPSHHQDRHSPLSKPLSLLPPTPGHSGYCDTEHLQAAYNQPFHHTSSPQHPFLPPNNPSLYKPPFSVSHQAAFQASGQPVHSYQHPPPPHPDSLLGKYAQFLRGYYTQHRTPCTKWPQLHTRKYINLAVINNVYANRKDLVKFRQQTIHGSIDDILEWKAPIKMKNILKPNCMYDDEKHEHYPVTQLLIEGAPGIGKSTFAWEVCQKWGQHQLFNEYSLVVLLKFRDKRVHEAKTVSDLFYHPYPKFQSEIVDYITTTGGHGLLLILEGFDEAPASKRAMDSIFVRLFTEQVLPKATVILTTRPSASAELRQFCNSVNSRRIEIVGFGKKETDEYIQCAFSDEQSRSDFKEYLSLYPHIHSMMYVPLNAAVVTRVYESCKSSGAIVSKTMTQLYSSLIRTLLLRYLKDKEEYKDTCTTINSFKDLPQPVYDQFCEICKIAYTGILSDETELDLQDLPSDFDTLGLMQSCPELYVDRGAHVSYNFLHLTVEEYLAAYHISQQSMDAQTAFMRDHIKTKKLEIVVRFLAGLSELGKDLWDVVRGFASKPIPAYSLLEEENNSIKCEVLHWLFESQDAAAITSVLGFDCVCFDQFDCGPAWPFDWYVLGYVISYSRCDWKLGLVGCELESAKVFLEALKILQKDQCLLTAGQIRGIWLTESDPAAVNLLIGNIPQMLAFHDLTCLGLKESKVTSDTCNLLSKHTDILLHLDHLNLSDNPNIGSGGAVNLVTSLTKYSTIRELHLNKTGIGLEDCKVLSELLATSKCIQVLNIGGNQLSPDSIKFVVDSLSRNTSLEKLDMRRSKFSSENILSLASVLRVNTTLKQLDIEHCIQKSGSVHLEKALEENTATQLNMLANPLISDSATVGYVENVVRFQNRG